MIRPAASTLAVIAVLIVASACLEDEQPDRACTTIAIEGLRVTVSGAGDPDGGTITVTATDGDYVEELVCGSENGSLVCSGATERAGTYLIEVVAGGDVVAMRSVAVGEDECHVITEDITL